MWGTAEGPVQIPVVLP
uniref:Uncharacterized protein n=1 Tax=Anguilla anguilla TaxID=7936 RepID=A0A0E9VC51_ANGAN